ARSTRTCSGGRARRFRATARRSGAFTTSGPAPILAPAWAPAPARSSRTRCCVRTARGGHSPAWDAVWGGRPNRFDTRSKSVQSRTFEGGRMRFSIYSEIQYWGGKTPKRAYDEVIEQVVHADRLGYDAYGVIEHFFFPKFSISANPFALWGECAAR